MTSVPTINLQTKPYYVLSIVQENGTANYLIKGEWTAFEIGYGSFKNAVKFDSVEEIQELFKSHPEFTKRNVYSDKSSAPPHVIWSGLGICSDKPVGKGWFVIQKVQTEVVYTQFVTDSHQGM